MGNQWVPGYSLIFHLKVLDLKFIFFEVLSMSHHHDVINQRLHGHRQNTFTVNFMNHGTKSGIKTLLYLISCNYLPPGFHQYLFQVSDRFQFRFVYQLISHVEMGNKKNTKHKKKLGACNTKGSKGSGHIYDLLSIMVHTFPSIL